MLSVMYVLVVFLALTIVVLLLKGRRVNYDGEIVVTETDEKKQFSIEIPGDPNELDKKRQIVLKVVSSSK